MSISFCPHCGEDLRRLAGEEPAVAPAPAQIRSIIKREVTTAEVERMWGLKPLPFQIRPYGMVVDGADQPVALACEDHERRLWELADGQVRSSSTQVQGGASPSSPAAPLVSKETQPPTVPEHVCNSRESSASREDRGRDRFGRQG